MDSDAGDSKGSNRDENSVRVYARVGHPGQAKTNQTDQSLCLTVDTVNHAIILKATPNPKVYKFDEVADISATQESVFSAVAKNLIDSCLAGYNGTIFAYGQTGSGKTFTMMGPSQDDNNLFHHELRGVIPRSIEYLFNQIEERKKLLGDRIQYACRASFLEIYKDQLSDLLDAGGRKLQLRENSKLGVIVEGITEPSVNSASDAYKVLIDGWKNRRVAETAMKTESSRSHAVFTIYIESKENKGQSSQIMTSRLNLVDLAGSERQKDTQTTGSRLKEGCSINKSLSALGNVVMSLAAISRTSKPHYVPYRDSKLTFLLKDSLGGNAKTHVIACVHQGQSHLGETLSTLDFVSRAKQIHNKAVVNEDLHGSIPALQAENRRLKKDLAAQESSAAALKEKMAAMESQIVALQTAKESIAKTLKMTQERCAIEREQQARLHLDTIKTITTPKTKYNPRLSLVMGSDSTSNSPMFNSPDVPAQNQAKFSFQPEQMPSAMYDEQIEGLTKEIETLQKGNNRLTEKIQEYEAKVISFATEQAALQSKNKSLEQKLASYDEKFSSVKKELHQTQELKQVAEEEVHDLRVMIAQMEETAKCDGLHQSNTSHESKVAHAETGADVILKLQNELSELQEECNILHQSHVEMAQRLVDVQVVVLERDQKLAAQESAAMENLKIKEMEIKNWKQTAENQKQMHDQEKRVKEKLELALSNRELTIEEMENDIAEKLKPIEDSKKEIESRRFL